MRNFSAVFFFLFHFFFSPLRISIFDSFSFSISLSNALFNKLDNIYGGDGLIRFMLYSFGMEETIELIIIGKLA